jgi:hypothetical protein
MFPTNQFQNFIPHNQLVRYELVYSNCFSYACYSNATNFYFYFFIFIFLFLFLFFFFAGPVQSKLEKLENWEKTVDIEWKTSVTVATQHGMHVAAQFCASALFCASILFCATGRRICGHRIRIPARNRSTNRGLTVHIPQNVPRGHSHTPCQVGKNVICGVALVISTILT